MSKGAYKMEKTETPGVYRRGGRFVVVWVEDGRQHKRFFASYEDACAFKRDWCLPKGQRRVPPSVVLAGTPPTGYVYFVQFGDGPVKIGWATNPAKRLASLATANAGEASLRALIPGPRSVEQGLHVRYRRWRLRGEFFSAEVLAALTSDLCNGQSVEHSEARYPPQMTATGETQI